MLTEIFCQIDDFCNSFLPSWNTFLKKQGLIRRNRARCLALSEVMTILVAFHHYKYRDFKSFYNNFVKIHLRKEFPTTPSYNRFLEIASDATIPLEIFIRKNLKVSDDKFIVDSTSLSVCELVRMKSNRVFKAVAKKGRTSTKEFFGLKLHIIVDSKGNIASFKITSGNTHDVKVVEQLSANISGKLYGDRGYISDDVWSRLLKRGVALITNVRKNMNWNHANIEDRKFLKKRGRIETIIGLLKTKFHLEHSRHRSIAGFFRHIYSTLVMYQVSGQRVSFC